MNYEQYNELLESVGQQIQSRSFYKIL